MTRPPGGSAAGRRPGKLAGAMDGPPSVKRVAHVISPDVRCGHPWPSLTRCLLRFEA